MQIPEEVVRSRDIILAYQINGKPLPESDTPVRIVVPGEFAMYWVKAVSSLELKKDSAKVAAVRMLFMDSSGLEPVDYSFDDEGDKALVLKELLDKFAIEYEGKPFLVKARDGLKKTEEMETAKKAYIKITGENAPEFISPDISYGMYVKNLVWFGTDKEVIMGLKQNLAAYFKSETIPLETVFKEVNMEIMDDKNYVIKDADGYSVDIKGKDLKQGELLLGDGGPRVSFKQLPKKYNIKNLMEISLKK
ncbi:MAG TPA: molybdopterin-dependent oxidoreductase [Thermoanaerobacterales bacterium]|nr:molybdopterin-dependent oxidoreductase [Thermoanaerobacterales bacterium]